MEPGKNRFKIISIAILAMVGVIDFALIEILLGISQ